MLLLVAPSTYSPFVNWFYQLSPRHCNKIGEIVGFRVDRDKIVVRKEAESYSCSAFNVRDQ